MQYRDESVATAAPRRDSDTGPDGDQDDDRSMDLEDLTPADLSRAEASRPDLPDENADGLDEMDEEIRHQAEDLPTERPGRG